MKSKRVLGAVWMLLAVVFCYAAFSLFDVRRRELVLQVEAGHLSGAAMLVMLVEVVMWLTSIAAGTAFLWLKGFNHCIGKSSANSKIF